LFEGSLNRCKNSKTAKGVKDIKKTAKEQGFWTELFIGSKVPSSRTFLAFRFFYIWSAIAFDKFAIQIGFDSSHYRCPIEDISFK